MPTVGQTIHSPYRPKLWSHFYSIETTAGKQFAGFYALFAVIVFLGTAGILVAPWAHRLLHTFNADVDVDD